MYLSLNNKAVVVSVIGARCGKCFPMRPTNGQHLPTPKTILADESKMLNRFLWYLINDESYWHRSGTAQPFIKPTDIQNAWIPVPPPNEQKQIVDRLDFLMASIKTHKNPYKRPRHCIRDFCKNFAMRNCLFF